MQGQLMRVDEAASVLGDRSDGRLAFSAWVEEVADPADAQEVPMDAIEELGEAFSEDLEDVFADTGMHQAGDALEDVFVDALDAEDAGDYFARVLRGVQSVARSPARPGIPPDLLRRFAGLLQRYRARRFDEMQAAEDLADQFSEEGTDEAASLVGGLLARALARPSARRPPRPMSRPLRRQLVRNSRQAAQTLVRRQGPRAIRALPTVARSVQRTAIRQRTPVRALPSAVRNVANRVARTPALAQSLSRSAVSRPSPTVPATSCTNLGRPEVLDRFEYDKDAVRPFHQPQIMRIAQCVVASQGSSQPIRSIRIVGHSDSSGPDWYNLQLGQRRAEQVRRHLRQAIETQQRGLANTIQFDVRSLGETQPTGKGANRDRRVEILLPIAGQPATCPCPLTRSSEFNAWLQKSLNQILGFLLPINGTFDVQTQGAVRSFQRRTGLAPTGVVNPRTLQAMYSAGAPTAPCQPRQVLGSAARDSKWEECLPKFQRCLTADPNNTACLDDLQSCLQSCLTLPLPIPPSTPEPPSIRRCCLLIPVTYKGEGKRINNFVDPSNLGNHRWHTEAVGIIYTCKAGFIDLGHLRDLCDLTRYVYDQIFYSGGVPTAIRTTHGSAVIHKPVPQSDWLRVARAISYDDSIGYEIYTYWFFTVCPPTVPLCRDLSFPGKHHSSFSPEDLCSNYLGTLLAERAIVMFHRWGGSFNTNVTLELDAMLKSLGAQPIAETRKAFDRIDGCWVYYKGNPLNALRRDYLRRRNFSNSPWYAGLPCDSAAPAWVAEAFSTRTTAYYSYTHTDGRVIPKAEFPSEIDQIRRDARNKYGDYYDRPTC